MIFKLNKLYSVSSLDDINYAKEKYIKCVSSSILEVSGDSTGAMDLLLYADKEYFGLFNNYLLAKELLTKKNLCQISPLACQFILGSGFVPPPYTMYENLFRLTIGDTITLNYQKLELAYKTNHLFKLSNSKSTNNYQYDKMKDKLTKTIQNNLKDEKIYFFQSSGKDSLAILTAFKNAGYTNVHCVTYNPKFMEDESVDAKIIAENFGYSHTIVESDPMQEFTILKDFCKTSPAINADYALIPYVSIVNKLAIKNATIVDGMGNDIYMGHIPPKIESTLKKLSIVRFFPFLWDKIETPNLGKHITYVLKSIFMYPSERVISGTHISPYAIKNTFGYIEEEYKNFFKTLFYKYKNLNEIDFRSYIRGRLFDNAACMEKGRLAAVSNENEIVFPFCDKDMIEYYFNMIESDKFDYNNRVNKIALRKMLQEEYGEVEYLSKKGSFRYDMVSFLSHNSISIIKEIENIDKLIPNYLIVFKRYWKHKNNYIYASMAYHLFILALWLNQQSDKHQIKNIFQDKRNSNALKIVISL